MRELPHPTAPLDTLTARASRQTAWHGTQARQHERPATSLSTRWARDADDVRAAQRLRHLVFADEMGAKLHCPPGTPAGHDVDMFDSFCEHLIVSTTESADRPAEVVGTYRVLTPQAARRAGGYYSEAEFDLTRLRPLRDRMVELGRSCVHPDYRRGGVVLALWSGLAAFMQRNRLDTMIGCASLSMRDGGHAAASLWSRLSREHLAPIEQHVRPRLPLPLGHLRNDLPAELPPLVQSYLRCGAKLLGPPAWDPDFNTADLPLIVRTADLPERYRRSTANT